MLAKIKSVITSNDPVANLVKSLFFFALLIPLIIYFSTASTSNDPAWFQSGFADLPDRRIVYASGQSTELAPGRPGFDLLAEAVRTSLAQGVSTQSNTGLSDVSLQEARSRYTSLEVFFAGPVKLHAWFYTGHPTQMLFPITGRHSDWPIVFLGNAGVYQVNGPVLLTKDPILQALRKLGYIQ